MILSLTKNEETKIRYQRLFDNIVDSTIILSYPDGEIKDINASTVLLLGYERKDLIGKNFWQMNLLANKAIALDSYAALLKSKSLKLVDTVILTKAGNELSVDISAEMYRLDHKPIIQLNIHNRAEIQSLKKELTQYKQSSVEAVGETIQALLKMTNFRDPYTASHQLRVSKLAKAIGVEMNLPSHQIAGIEACALVHDIGKISIPSEILTKPSALNTYEMALIKNHVQVGFDIIKGLQFPWEIAKILLQHHERNDGSGYPYQLTETEICIEAKILAVADTTEAMAHFRPYRPALGIEAALHQIALDRGCKFDPLAVDTCINLFKSHKFSFNENKN